MNWAAMFRDARGCLTQREAAAAIYSGRDITRTIQDWELGRNSPPDWVQPLVLGVLRRAAGRKTSAANRKRK